MPLSGLPMSPFDNTAAPESARPTPLDPNVWVNLLCYTLSISSLNLFKLYLCLSSTQAPFQQQSNPAAGYLSYPSQYNIQFSPLDACYSSLMMKTEDASATLAPMQQRKWGFTHAGMRDTHTYSQQYIGRHNT